MYKSIEVRISLENSSLDPEFSDVGSEISKLCATIVDFTEFVAVRNDGSERCWPIVDSHGSTVGYIKTIDLKEEPTCSC